MPIECEIDASRSLLVCRATGELNFEEIRALQDRYFEKYITQNVILDLSLVSVKKLEPRDIEIIVDVAESKKTLRPLNGKTALVASSPLVIGFARTYAVFFELRELPWELEVFRSMDEALDWIGSVDVTVPEHAFEPRQFCRGAG